MAPLDRCIPAATNLILVAIALSVVYNVGYALYNVFLHPLRKFPGPISHRMSNAPRAYYNLRGDLSFHVADLHAKYGNVVRIGPNSLAFLSPEAWKDIYGHKAHGEQEFPKHQAGYRPVESMPKTIIHVDREEHAFLRRQLAHGFSERSMRGQEPIIGAYADKLIERLRENVVAGKNPLNMREWFNWATFDIIGDLALGSSFGCLEESKYHAWVGVVNGSIQQISFLVTLRMIGATCLVNFLAKYAGGMGKRQELIKLTEEKVKQRMDLGTERPDFIEGFLQKKEQVPFDALIANASTLIVAGSETTATLLCGAVYLLATNPECLEKVTQEVRSSFRDDSGITLLSVGNLRYMLACLNEALRMYPPVASALPRQAPKGGATVSGHFVPEGTQVGVWQWAINHAPGLWTDPNVFRPERFLGDPRFTNDRLDAMQPFLVGPRNCIGKNLAYAEMRLILAKIIFNFDLRLADESRNWLKDQKAFTVWLKSPLPVYLTPAQH
ncbi:hypothetical protein DL766_010411 [Monosporascus sp. MC13-8B]|uniref:Cytochrome P450 n=1 Tax=Monosporascus cannonballus TaxID=155416 RepID=A0ABY0HJI0_9PEZI|nr:hypothetical protein DL763_004529 [Monosporascus cannonballus]RYO93896.1 hypothetical protein DL762_000851 [Monosporascus cannonballus]RYP02324.1 hypothetical protein DL766_010411 [Monosporascus sp. MC13-8B]